MGGFPGGGGAKGPGGCRRRIRELFLGVGAKYFFSGSKRPPRNYLSGGRTVPSKRLFKESAPFILFILMGSFARTLFCQTLLFWPIICHPGQIPLAKVLELLVWSNTSGLRSWGPTNFLSALCGLPNLGGTSADRNCPGKFFFFNAKTKKNAPKHPRNILSLVQLAKSFSSALSHIFAPAISNTISDTTSNFISQLESAGMATLKKYATSTAQYLAPQIEKKKKGNCPNRNTPRKYSMYVSLRLRFRRAKLWRQSFEFGRSLVEELGKKWAKNWA